MVDLEKKSGAPFHGIVAFPGAGGLMEEKGLINLMKKHFPLAHGNEYFKCTFDDAYDIVAEYCNSMRPKFLAAEERRHSQQIHGIRLHIERLEKDMEILRSHVLGDKVFMAFQAGSE